MITTSFLAIGRALLLICLLCLPSTRTSAHDPKLASVKVIRESARTTIGVSVHVSALSQETGALSSPDLESALRGRLALEFDGEPWNPATGMLQLDSANDLAYWQGSYPQPVTRVRLLAPLISKDAGAFTVLQVFLDGKPVDEQILDAGSPRVSDKAGPLWSLRRFFVEGLRHIAGGFDHLAFVMGLVLVSRTTRRAFWAATGFTVAHSLTLVATTLGWIAPNSAVVEALVAASIALVAADALWGGDRGSRRIGVHALGFGLVHGMAFASAITALMSGSTAIGVALIGFNAGVEVGQGLFVLASAPLLGWLAVRSPNLHGHLRNTLASFVGLAGLWWLGGRMAGLFVG